MKLTIEHQLLTLTLDTPLQKASTEQLLSFERCCDVSNLFQEIFGTPDHTRWLVLEEDNMKAQFIPGKANKDDPYHNDMVRKVVGMRYMLQRQHHEMLYLDEKTQLKIYEKASEFINNQSINREPFILQDSTWINIRGALRLLINPITGDQDTLDAIADSMERRAPTTCNVFCESKVIQKQLVSSHKWHNILTNSCPYVKHHVMLVTHTCHRQSSERNTEEILEKYKLILRILLVFMDRFGCSSVGVCTRKGTLAGQSQLHLHDHIIGLNSHASDQFWMHHWANELLNRPIDAVPMREAICRIKTIMPKLFSPLKAIIFDIGGVVVKQFNKEVEWLKALVPDEDYSKFLEPLTKGQMNEDQFWKDMGQKYDFIYDDEFREKWKKIYLESNPICKKVTKAIDGFRRSGLKVYALSNTIPSHHSFNEERGLFRIFDGMVQSYQVGMSKPGSQIYAQSIALTNLKPEEILFVDDREVNILPAHEAGMHAFVWRNANQGLERTQAYLNFREEES